MGNYQHSDVVSCQVVNTELFIVLTGTVISGEVVLIVIQKYIFFENIQKLLQSLGGFISHPNIFCASTNKEPKVAHFVNALRAGEPLRFEEKRNDM